MTLQQINAFINALWKELIKPTWEKSEQDWEEVVSLSGKIGGDHGNTDLVVKMINAYLTALEEREKSNGEVR